MDKRHYIGNIEFDSDTMRVLIDGQQYSFNLQSISKVLFCAKNEDREKYSISPAGYGVHWSTLDEDLSIDGLLSAYHKMLEMKKSA